MDVDDISSYRCSENWFSVTSFDIGECICCRAAETRLLLHKIVYEKAKLQLMGVKRRILLVFWFSCVFPFFIYAYSLSSALTFACRKKDGYWALEFRSVKCWSWKSNIHLNVVQGMLKFTNVFINLLQLILRAYMK